jgi:hypothetical protein
MKLKFVLLTCLLLFARGCDFYSTSLWFFDHPEGETNPLTSILGFGWNALLIGNFIAIGIIIYMYYFYSFKYTPKKITEQAHNLKDFISQSYFNQKGKFYQVFYKSPKNKNILKAHMGYVLIRVIIIGSFLATFHNLAQYYQFAFYDTFRNIVKRPLFVIYGLLIMSAMYFIFKLWKHEFNLYKSNLPHQI